MMTTQDKKCNGIAAYKSMVNIMVKKINAIIQPFIINSKIHGCFLITAAVLALILYSSFIPALCAAAHSMELIAQESKSLKVGQLQYVKHSKPVKFNVRVGAYYYWRVLFSDIATEEFFTRDTLFHQFTLKSNPPGGIGYRAVLQRKLYSWESWKNYYEDPAQYAVDTYEPIINTMEPETGIVSQNPFITFKWRGYDEGTGLHATPYTFMLLTGSQKPLYNSGWTTDTSYTPAEPLTPGTYLWGIHVRDNDENITRSRFYTFSINSSEPPSISHFEVSGPGASTNYTSSESVTAELSATDNMGVSHYYISEEAIPLEINDARWVSVGKPTMSYSASVPFKIKFKHNNFTAENHYNYAHKLYLWFKDLENNVSQMKTYALITDITPPRNTSISINNRAQFTLKREVKLKLEATDNIAVIGYLIKESAGSPQKPSANDPAWVINRSFELMKMGEFDYTLSEDIGTKTLFVWYRDDAANISEAASASIQYDTKPPISPIIGSIGLKNVGTGDNFINSREATFLLKASGSYNNQITAFYLKESKYPQEPLAEDSGWQLFFPAEVKVETEARLTLSPQDGTKEVYAWFKDSFSNISAPYKCELLFDREPPSGSFTIENDGAWNTKKQVQIHINAYDSIAVSAYLTSVYRYDNQDLKNNPNLWNYIAPQKSISLKTDIDLTDINGERNIYLWLKDGAGNICAPFVKTINLDNQPPVFGALNAEVVKIAGSGAGFLDGPAQAAQFDLIDSVHANYKDEIYVADFRNRRVRKIKDGFVTTFAGCGQENREIYGENAIVFPSGIVEDDYGIVYITDGHLSKQVEPDGTVKRYAGNDFRNPMNPNHHSGDDPNVETRPRLLTEFKQTNGICIDRYGNAYISDVRHIRRIRNDIATVYAGNTASNNTQEGPAIDIKLSNAADITVDTAGSVYFPDAGLNIIRKVTSDGLCKIIAGGNGSAGNQDGFAGINRLFNPTTITVDKFGVIYIADFGNNQIRRLTPDGYLSTIKPSKKGLEIVMPNGLTLLSDGCLIFGEQEMNQVKKITFTHSDGIELMPGQDSESGIFKIMITASDNYSGISSYYLSNIAAAPSTASGGWININYNGGEQTFEVSYAPSNPKETQTLYAWLKDRAGNISNYQSIKLNEKTMQIVDSFGDSSVLSSPSAVACDRNNNIYAADLSIYPITKFKADKTHTKHGTAGYLAGQLGSISSIVAFNDGCLGVIESSKLRFSFIDDTFKIINYISQSIDLSLNINDEQTVRSAPLRDKIIDKYSSENKNAEFGINYGFNFDFSHVPDFYFSPQKLEIYTDANYTQKLNGPVSSYKYPVLYLKVSGSGSEGKRINSIIARVTSTSDTAGSAVQFIETGEETNVFKASMKIGRYSSVLDSTTGIKLDDKIYITFYSRSNSKTFTLNISGQWIFVGENQTSNSSATYISMKIFNGIIYVAYSDEQQSDKVSVVKCEDNRWSYVGEPGISKGAAREVKIDIYNSNPCVLYSDMSSDFKTTVIHFNGTKWDSLGSAEFSEPKASYLSLCVSGDSVFVAYTNWLLGSQPQIMRYNPAGGWSAFNDRGLPKIVVDFNNIVSDGGALYFLTRDNHEAGFLLYKYIDNEWIELTDGPSRKQCDKLDLKIYNSTPYVLYANADGLLHLTKYENNEWIKVGRNAISDGAVIFNGLAFGENGTPYVVSVDSSHGNRVVVMNYINEEWVSVGEKGISPGMAGYTCIYCYDNEPYIAFRDVTAGERLKVMKFEY